MNDLHFPGPYSSTLRRTLWMALNNSPWVVEGYFWVLGRVPSWDVAQNWAVRPWLVLSLWCPRTIYLLCCRNRTVLWPRAPSRTVFRQMCSVCLLCSSVGPRHLQIVNWEHNYAVQDKIKSVLNILHIDMLNLNIEMEANVVQFNISKK